MSSLLFDVRSNLWVTGVRGCFRWPLRPGKGAGEWTLGPPARVGPAAPAQRAAVSHDGRVVVVSAGPIGHVFDAETGARLSTLPGNSDKRYVAVSPDGEWIATCTWNARAIRVWNARDGTLRTNLVPPQWKGGSSAADLAFTPDGRWLLVCSLGPDTSAWDTRDWKMRWTKPRADLPSVAVSPDGSLAAVRDAKRFVHLIAPETGETLAVLESPSVDHVSRMAFSPDGTQLAVCGGAQRELAAWDLRGLRRSLVAMNLDWNAPPYPPVSTNAAAPPVRLQVVTEPVPDRVEKPAP